MFDPYTILFVILTVGKTSVSNRGKLQLTWLFANDVTHIKAMTKYILFIKRNLIQDKKKPGFLFSKPGILNYANSLSNYFSTMRLTALPLLVTMVSMYTPGANDFVSIRSR
jgi:hypothetical protein